MSDSDDTDILLLIPPNYFATATPEELEEFQIINPIRSSATAFTHDVNYMNAYIGHKNHLNHSEKNINEMEVTLTESNIDGASDQRNMEMFVANKYTELNEINSRLKLLEREKDCRFTAASDISTISNGTQAARHNREGLVHSTPKCYANTERLQSKDAGGILNEIDNFLDDRNREQMDNVYQQEVHNPNSIIAKSQQMKNRYQQAYPDVKTTLGADVNLISLSEIWGKSGQGTAIACAAPQQSVYIEEQLRRQHLERTVHSLQTRLLEYQQRLSVAIEVDRAKDAAICNAQSECKSLDAEVNQLREKVSKLEADNTQYSTKLESLQKELAQALSLVTKFQDKSEKLENELSTTSRKTNECITMYKQQIEELEVKIHGCKRSEEFAINELNKFKDKLVKVDYLNEKLKTRCDELEKDCGTLRNQKELLQEFQQKQKTRADALETQRKVLQEKVTALTESEINLKKKMELQQKTLKTHYQQQLENAVAQKMKEFQQQLDKNEEILKVEARERERLIAERAVKQIELINEKNEMELNLLQEKQKEEVELYRIQLANATKKIEDLDCKLNAYKTKRAVIAEKLHDVMEDQWQKALEILTSPSNQSQQISNNTDCESPANNENELNKDDSNYRTPKKNKTRDRILKIKENNLNNNNERKSSPEPMDRLQAYIELLLSKSPSEFDKLDEILALASKTKSSTSNSKSDKHMNFCKPPWRG
ncbi:PREDICTED: DNA repair protein RAD50 [Bactrocera latifrons]|uniref:Centrobin n=1 Tax=Bactrocera latifrons TaxID=174628 RepID=A0A0K8V9Y4_BACLA|nr:PREDICTED: DNA repair protein RAD50 [Bactrocera latifrons]